MKTIDPEEIDDVSILIGATRHALNRIKPFGTDADHITRALAMLEEAREKLRAMKSKLTT
jgi:hypothetical protein